MAVVILVPMRDLPFFEMARMLIVFTKLSPLPSPQRCERFYR
jgi:hypothetical protein